MPDAGALLDTLEEFAETLTTGYGVSDVLHTLAEQVAAVLGLTGAGVLLVRQGRLSYVTAPVETIADLERVVEDRQNGPCVDATTTRQPVTVTDLAAGDCARRWPEYAVQAKAGHIRAVAAIPMFSGDRVLGALGLYDGVPHAWASDELRVSRILANMATGYVVHASELEQQRRTAEQLKRALETRVVIEQAKGILAAERDISLDAAYETLRRHARNHNARLHDVASAVVHLHLRP